MRKTEVNRVSLYLAVYPLCRSHSVHHLCQHISSQILMLAWLWYWVPLVRLSFHFLHLFNSRISIRFSKISNSLLRCSICWVIVTTPSLILETRTHLLLRSYFKSLSIKFNIRRLSEQFLLPPFFSQCATLSCFLECVLTLCWKLDIKII